MECHSGFHDYFLVICVLRGRWGKTRPVSQTFFPEKPKAHPMNIPSSETQFIHQAADYLESTPLTKQLANLVHLPGKSLIESVVPSWMVDVFAKSLSQILSVATKTIGEEANQT